MEEQRRTVWSGAQESAGPGPVGMPLSDCAHKFSTLAELFREPCEANEDHVRALLLPCSGPAAQECSMLDTNLLVAGNRAIRWFENSGNVCVLHAEHSRLFTGDEHGEVLPRLSPCAATHLEGSREDVIDGVRQLYDDLGFACAQSGLDPDCPCHIANELDFVAHCLRTGRDGVPGGFVAAGEFLGEHLFPWGIVFAAALTAIAEHPVTRFAGLALESLLFCEASAEFQRYREHAERISS